ncbi:MAG TPA: hypothetical protein VGO00_18675 [Kofleriaceae bacterium]|nr:hypothetical protein [Kofleriaceae bacterium]
MVLVPVVAFAESRVDPPGAGDAEPLRGNVLVWHDAAFYVEPSDAATTVHVATLTARKDLAGHVVPMHVLGTRGAFVEVEPTDVDCTWSRFTTSDDLAKLHLFVKRSDLAPVVTKPFDKTFSDGTHVALRPGVAVVPEADGVYAVSFGGDDIDVEIPPASIGHAYTPERAKPIVVNAQDYALAPATKATLGDRPVRITRHASVVDKHDATTLYTIDSRCAAVTVAVPSGAVSAVDDGNDTSVLTEGRMGMIDVRGSDYFPIATTLSTPSGIPVATAAKKIYLPGTGMGKQACFDRRMWLDTPSALAPDRDGIDDKLRLCAPSSKVAHDKVRTSAR